MKSFENVKEKVHEAYDLVDDLCIKRSKKETVTKPDLEKVFRVLSEALDAIEASEKDVVSAREGERKARAELARMKAK